MKKYLWLSILVSSIIGTLLISTYIYTAFKNEQEKIFILRADLIDNAIARKIQMIEAVLKNYQTLFHSKKNIDPDMFRIFSKDVLKTYPYMNQFHFSPQVGFEEKTKFEKDKRFLGYHNFTIRSHENKSRDSITEPNYYPTLYIEPFTPKNSRSLGLDIYSHSQNKTMIDKSIASGNISVSLKQEDDSVTFFIPVYHDKTIPFNIEERKDRINGIISMKVFLNDLIKDLDIGNKKHFLLLNLEHSKGHSGLYENLDEQRYDLLKADKNVILIEKLEEQRFDLLQIFELEKDHAIFLDKIKIGLHVSQSYQLYDIPKQAIVMGFILLLFIVFTIYYLLKKHLALKEELEKSIRQENMLIQQSKLAAMGEMIGNIAHQWRQPLAQLSAIHMNMKVTYDFNNFTKEYLKEKLKEANDLTAYMSNTITDFQNFFKPKGDKEDFSVSAACSNSFQILESAFNYHDIKVDFNIKKDTIVNGYQNEYAQVFLNILSNAKDIIIEREIENPIIKVEIKQDKDGNSIVSIEDNAGGIPIDIIDKIFEPYFTTRHKTKGTGIGLYMSKNIIERNMDGEINVKNTQNGAYFTIKVKASIQ